MNLEDSRALKEKLKKLLGVKPESDVAHKKEAMGRYVGSTDKSTRSLKWKRFAIGTPLPVPQLMRDELETLMHEFRAAFAPYTKSEAVKNLYRNFSGMAFSWYAEDASVSDDDMRSLRKDETVPPDEKAKLKWVADFIQNKGVQLQQPGEEGHDDPKNSTYYGNLSDLHLSDCGYAFADFVPVTKGKASVALNTVDFNDGGSPDPWQAGMAKQAQDPDMYGRVFQIVVRPTRRGTYGLFAEFKTPDGRGNKVVPALSFSARADINRPDTYKGNFKGFLINNIVPGQSYVFFPNGPTGPMKLVAGTAKFVRLLGEKGLTHWLDQYRNEDGTIRQAPLMKADKKLTDMVYQLDFDGPEGGLIARNNKGTIRLTESQVRSIINPGEVPGGYRSDGRSALHLVVPAKVSPDADGQAKPAGFGPWDIKAADREKLRAQFKPLMDKLSSLTMQYRTERHSAKGEEYRPHTPAQNYSWIVVVPRFQIPNIIPGGKGRGMIFNRKYMGPKHGQPSSQPTGSAAIASGNSKLQKEAVVYQPGVGSRQWVVVTHDINPNKFEEVGGKRFPYEAMKGDTNVEFPTAEAAIQFVMSSYKVPPVAAAKIAAADHTFQAACADIEQGNVQPDMSTPEAVEEQQIGQKQEQLAAQPATSSDRPAGKHLHEVTANDLPGLFDHLSPHQEENQPPQAVVPTQSQPTRANDAMPMESILPQQVPGPKQPRKQRTQKAPPMEQPSLFGQPTQPTQSGENLTATASSIARKLIKKYGL